MVAVAVFVLRMNAPHLADLWCYCIFAAVVIAIGTLTLLAALRTLGQLVALIIVIYLGLASSGGTVPLPALSPFYRFVAQFEPPPASCSGSCWGPRSPSCTTAGACTGSAPRS